MQFILSLTIIQIRKSNINEDKLASPLEGNEGSLAGARGKGINNHDMFAYPPRVRGGGAVRGGHRRWRRIRTCHERDGYSYIFLPDRWNSACDTEHAQAHGNVRRE